MTRTMVPGVGQPIASETLQDVVQRLVCGLQPERIYLFGSQAHGSARWDSDVDLLVVMPHSDEPRHRREARSYDLLWGLTLPVELVVLTHDEFEAESRVKSSLASTVLSEGALLYG